jgi:hypothetical protein
MTGVSEFYEIQISMESGPVEDGPPRFSARYREFEGTIEIATGAALDGDLGPTALELIAEWGEAHREELEHNWHLCQRGETLKAVAPLS